MANNSIKSSSKMMIILGGLSLIAVLFVPLWRIDLDAPQYPEGLSLFISPKGLGGNVDIVNGLNHYIGMKKLHSSDFIEFTILPYCIIFFIAAFLFTGILGKRKILYTLLGLYIAFGIIAMADFWKWEYDYGHNLDPDAPIKVPGMAYQPPLIGFKQLLNFGAYSVPDIGGWLFITAGALLLLAVIAEVRGSKKNNILKQPALLLCLGLLTMFLQSCTLKPEAIKVGSDNCSFCKMTISDNRFGAEILTKKGKLFKFDDMHCILSFLHSNTIEQKDIQDIYVTNFSGNHSLVKAPTAFFAKSDDFKSPMNGNIAAFENEDSLKKILIQYKGNSVSWNDIAK
ncbi:MAG: nitrous oxide reductase accessory protein NosL [Bacteroidota bacterium]|nr:nitrous oxide reductase accessory protein NosL [Bacteroidota bacterium]